MLGGVYLSRHVGRTVYSACRRFIHLTAVNTQQTMTQQDAHELMLQEMKQRKQLSEDEARDALSKLEGEDLKRLEIIKLEYEVARASGQFTPEVVSYALWWELYTAGSDSRRKTILRYHAKNEISRRNKERKKAERQAEVAAASEKVTKVENGFTYTLNDTGSAKNTIFLRILKPTMDKHYYKNVFNSFSFGSKIVFDMSFDRYMRTQDITNTIDQFLELHGFNKKAVEPFHIYFCNLHKDSDSYKRFEKSTCHPSVTGEKSSKLDELPFTITEQSYLDLFPKERLVYLTPQAPDMLETYDPNDVYIIGGLVDKVVTKPVSFAKAKREGLRMARFPFDLYMKWQTGGKSITLDQAVKILLTIKHTGSWRQALEHVPRRKRIFYDEL